MTSTWSAGAVGRPLSAAALYLLAAALRTASDLLTRLAGQISATEAITAPVQTVEFHALHRDSGAPEGALYVNGELVGVITGVTRL